MSIPQPLSVSQKHHLYDVMAKLFVDSIFEMAQGPKDGDVDEGAYMDDDKERAITVQKTWLKYPSNINER